MLHIHVGVPKSGTSTLQQVFFPRHAGIDYREWPKLPAFYEAIYAGNANYSADVLSAARSEVAAAFQPNGRPIVLSKEHLTRHNFNAGLFADRLAAVLGTFKVIITIREQLALLESGYLWDLRQLKRPWSGGIPARSFDAFLHSHWNAMSSPKQGSRIAGVEYSSIIRHYERLVGRENVGVFLFEEMTRDHNVFSDQLCKFIGVDPAAAPRIESARNPRLSKRELFAWKAMAYCVPLPLNKVVQEHLPEGVRSLLAGGDRVTVKMPDEWRIRLRQFFAPGNRYLVSEYGLPLERHGYAL